MAGNGGDVLHDAPGRVLSVTHARNVVAFEEDTIELRNVHLHNVAYRVSPPAAVQGQVRLA